MESNVSIDRTASVLSFIRMVTTAIATATLYSTQHQQVRRLCESAFNSLKEAMDNEQELSLLLIDDEIIFRQHPLPNSMYNNRFCQSLKLRGISHLRFMQAVTRQDIVFLLHTLSTSQSDHQDVHSSDNLKFGKIGIRQATDEETGSSRTATTVAVPDLPVEELSAFMELYEEARQNRKINITGVARIVSSFIDTFGKVANPLMAIAPLRVLDEYTFTHSTNVCILNIAQAMSLGIEGQLLNDIGIAAMLHDIGKLYVPEEVLTKAGKLDDSEWDLMKQHPAKGAQRLLDTPGVPRLAVVTAYEHHLKYDRTGYPRVADSWQQNLCSHMTTISDIFDALRTKRAYRGSMEFTKISGIMLEMAGTELHPVLTRNFLRIISSLSEEPPVEALEQ